MNVGSRIIVINNYNFCYLCSPCVLLQMDHIINNYGISTPDVQPSHKVSSGGYVNLEKAQGAEMGLILRMDGEKSPREVKQGILHQVSQGRSVFVNYVASTVT